VLTQHFAPAPTLGAAASSLIVLAAVLPGALAASPPGV